MAALASGVRAPEVDLPDLQGGRFSLHNRLKRGPVVLFFFKISCPVCQYAAPLLERLHRAYPDAAIYGVSQNSQKDTERFCREFGTTFPVLLDDSKSYPASNAYGLTNVPSIFLVGSDGEIEVSSVGWSKKDVEEIGRHLGTPVNGPRQLFPPGEQVADFRAG